MTPSITLTEPVTGRDGEVLTDRALALVAVLHERFAGRRADLLAARSGRGRPDFLAATADVRADPAWRVPPAPPGLVDRRVEITGPPEPKMAVNALNSGARVWMADLEDSNTPHWRNVVGGVLVLRDAALGRLRHETAEGRVYEVAPDALPGRPGAVTVVTRPRGWHYDEPHVLVDGAPAVAALVDLALHVCATAEPLLENGTGPYYYLPKLEGHREAALWHDVLSTAEDHLGLARGTVRATVLVETLPAAFEMEEILHALGEHATGLNAGRWDYLFSTIKTLRDDPAAVLPDRDAVTMTAPFLRAYTELLVATCHRRGAHAIGGMAAFIPSRKDPEVNARALAKVRADKEREAGDGFDGSWVAHPDLVPVCTGVFDAVLGEAPHQLGRLRDDVSVSAADLLDLASTPGGRTLEGLRGNVFVALAYLSAWIGGTGAVAIRSLMEDAATAEISRTQVWQWLHHGVVLDDGTPVTKDLVERLLDEEAAAVGQVPAFAEHLPEALDVLRDAVLAPDLADFVTLLAQRRTRG